MAKELFQIADADGVNVIELVLPDAIDAVEFDRLNEALLKLVATKAEQRWILDLTGADYIGSVVLGLMVNVRQQIKQAGGVLVLCGLSDRMAEVFRACSLERLFKITRTRNEATRAVIFDNSCHRCSGLSRKASRLSK